MNVRLAIARLQSKVERMEKEDADLQASYGDCVVGSVRASNRWDVLAIKSALSELEKLRAARQEGRIEALNAVFQVNGPSRAIAQLKKKWGIDQKPGVGTTDIVEYVRNGKG
jgi:uncharacterized protein (UPF0335 family)